MALDIIILVVIGAAVVIGAIRGAIAQLAMIVGIVAGIVAARIFGDDIARFLGGGSPDTLAVCAGYAVAFIGAYLLGWVVVRLFRKVVHGAHLGIFDRVAGAILKAFVWTLALSIVLNFYLIIKGNSHELDHPKKPWRALVVRLAPATLGYLNKEIG